MPTALITGITGQDGSWLTELLLEKGYTVHGIVRRSSSVSTGRIHHLLDRITLHDGDLLDESSLRHAVEAACPDEVYNLAAQSHVGTSWRQPTHTSDVVALGCLRMLEAVQRFAPHARFYQASTCEIFGTTRAPQNEQSMLQPGNPYAVAKAMAHRAVQNHREATGSFAVNGILFNHESERRGETFVTRKITRAVGRIVTGSQRRLSLGSLSARRDWGHAEDYVQAMWAMLQHHEPQDFVIATGVSHSVEEFVDAAFRCANLDWREFVDHDPALLRPIAVPELRGDPSHAANQLGWTPKTSFEGLVDRMVQHDIALAREESSRVS